MAAIDRRTFLQSGAVLPALLTFGAAQPQTRGKVIVIGGGLAGLSAGYELNRAGYNVVILEARGRSGGRVYTLREPFSDGLYAEAGAARIQDTHAFTLRYVKQFGLTLDPFFPSSGARITRVGDTRLVGPPMVDIAKLPLTFSDEERRLGYIGSLSKYLFAHFPELGDPASPSWPSQDLSRFELSIADFCQRQGASSGMLKMTALGHDLSNMSALQFLRDLALGASTKQWFKIRGGNDQLPRALSSVLSDKIYYGADVVRLEQDSTSVRAILRRGDPPVTISGDYLVCTLPVPVLRRVEFAPAVSAAKRAAIDQVGSLPMARVYLQSRRRFWLERGESGWASTDDPIDIWDYTRDQPGVRGILGAYTSGEMANQLTRMDGTARETYVLGMMEKVHPGIRENFEVSASYSWVSDPWAMGAGVEFNVGQLSKHYQPLRTPEGRIHFAGEHTSPWSGWMNGGLESGNRAAAEIQAR